MRETGPNSWRFLHRLLRFAGCRVIEVFDEVDTGGAYGPQRTTSSVDDVYPIGCQVLGEDSTQCP